MKRISAKIKRKPEEIIDEILQDSETTSITMETDGKEVNSGQYLIKGVDIRANYSDQVDAEDNREHKAKRRRLNPSSSVITGGDLTAARDVPDSMEQDVSTLLSDDESSSDSHQLHSQPIPAHIVTFSNPHWKLTVAELILRQSGSYQIQAMLEWILGGDSSEVNPFNILYGRCLTCGKLEPLDTFAVDFQSVGYACCYREGLTEVVRCFKIGFVLYDHTCGLSNGLFARVTSQHAEEILGCSPAQFQGMDGMGRFRILERVRGLQVYPVQLIVSVRKSEVGNALECHVIGSKIITNSQ